MLRKNAKRFSQIGIIILLPLLVLVGISRVMDGSGPTPVQAAPLVDNVHKTQPALIPPQQGPCNCESGDILNCANFEYQEEAQACLEYCVETTGRDVHRLDANDNNGVACDYLPSDPSAPEPEQSQEATPAATAVVPGPTAVPSDNLITNGNFEFGFYQVPELGFEPPDVGNVPQDWNWFKSSAYGKYNISNNEGFGLVCRDDTSQSERGKNSLSFHMQSTDQPDARLGVYQKVNVVPGQDYLFSISGTIQVQAGGSSPDQNHWVEIYLDQTGNTNWQAIPNEDWTLVRWPEEELEFKTSGEEDPDIARIFDYYDVVTAESNTMTVFIQGWRRWPNWRTGIFTFDCVSLVPLGNINVGALVPDLSDQSTTEVDEALEASMTSSSGSSTAAEPAVSSSTGADSASASETTIIPSSGGILNSQENWLLITVTSIVVIIGLVGAGIWNIQRKKR